MNIDQLKSAMQESNVPADEINRFLAKQEKRVEREQKVTARKEKKAAREEKKAATEQHEAALDDIANFALDVSKASPGLWGGDHAVVVVCHNGAAKARRVRSAAARKFAETQDAAVASLKPASKKSSKKVKS